MNEITANKDFQLKGQMAVLVTAVLWSTGPMFMKMLDLHPVVITGLRSFVALTFLLIARIIFPPPKGVKNPAFPFWAAVAAYVGVMYTHIGAVTTTTATNAVMLLYSAPIWAALLGWRVAKEKLNWEHWGALVFVTIGLVLFFRDGLDSGALFGNILAAISGFFLGANMVFLRMLKDGNPRDAMLMAHLIAFVLSIPFITFNPPSIEISTVLPLLYLGAVQMGITGLLFSYGIKRVTAIQAVLTSIIEPILTPVWVLLLFSEKPSVMALAGGGIIVSAVLASSLIGIRRVTRNADNTSPS